MWFVSMEKFLKKNRKDINLNTYFFAMLLTVVMLLVVVIQANTNFSALQVFTFIINGVIIWVMFIKGLNRHLYSLDLVHSIFCLLFLWVAPILQFSTRFTAWGLYIDSDDSIKANVLILLWLIFYNMGCMVVKNSHFRTRSVSFSKISKKPIFVLWWITIILTIVVLVKNKFKIEEITFVDSDEQSISLLLNHTAVAFMTFSTLITTLWFKYNNYSKFFSLISIVCLILTCFPTSISRYAAGSIYICLLVNLCPWFQKKSRLIFVILFGIVVLFPVMGLYRYRGITEVPFSEIIDQIFSVDKYFTSGNYDAYQMLIAINKYVDMNGITFGKQLLGVILFFVPRQMWSSKPVGSGAYVSSILGLSYDNISCPIVGEAYINFGVVGIAIFAIVFGVLLRKIDNTFWQSRDKQASKQASKEFSFIRLLYFYLMPYILFLCRGDMQSTWAYLFANLVVLGVLVKVIKGFAKN